MASAPRVGAVFDIDGVLVRGPHVLPGATDAILDIIKAGIPHIFVTNSGTLALAEGHKEPIRSSTSSSLQSLHTVIQHGFPGHTDEATRAHKLGETLGVPVQGEHMTLCHSSVRVRHLSCVAVALVYATGDIRILSASSWLATSINKQHVPMHCGPAGGAARAAGQAGSGVGEVQPC